MQISVNAIVTVEPGATNFNWDNEVRSFSIENLNAVDAIILGRKTAEDFIPYWEKVSKDPTHNDYEFGKRLTDIPKVVFSVELKTSKWTNATIVNGNISEEIQKLKSKEGRDMIVYGGISFVSSLIEHKLIDEAHLALRVSNAVLLMLLFATGYWWARFTLGKPWLVGLCFLVGGVGLVTVAIALGG